ncbi:hypothetical protein A2U01_0114243, partial [Trifolium medium]|nr:hypothetical protein [Trifolium medium]
MFEDRGAEGIELMKEMVE